MSQQSGDREEAPAWRLSLRALGADLIEAWSAWRSAPWLPLVSVSLYVLFGATTWVMADPDVTPGIVALATLGQLGIALLFAGWLGKERLLYLMLWRGIPIRWRHLRISVRWYMGRFVALGILTTLLFGAAALVLYLGLSPMMSGVVGLTISVVLACLLIDVALTFVTPALAYQTKSARQALRLGLRTLRNNWPQDLGYALLPPLVLTVLGQLVPVPYLQIPVAVGAGLLASLTRGAIARAYLRLEGVNPRNVPYHVARELPAGRPADSPTASAR